MWLDAPFTSGPFQRPALRRMRLRWLQAKGFERTGKLSRAWRCSLEANVAVLDRLRPFRVLGFSISPNSSGVPPTGVAPKPESFSRNDGVSRALEIVFANSAAAG